MDIEAIPSLLEAIRAGDLNVVGKQAVKFDEAKDLVFPEDLAWLETVKAFVAKDSLIPLDKLLVMAPEESA